MDSFKQFLNKKTKTPEQLATKHKVPIEKIKQQIKLGVSVEKEHTTHKDVAKQIALNHIDEKPNYYTKLKKVEGENTK